MKAGDVFDPVEVTRQLKLYPVDRVDARKDISDGPKRLYSQLFPIAVTTDRRSNPWPGYVYGSERFLVERLGKSASGIKRDLASLRLLKLIRVERPNKAQNNRYFFVWDESFESPDVSSQDQPSVEDEGSNVSPHDSSHVSPHIRSDSPDVGPLYKEKQRVVATVEKAPRTAAPQVRISSTRVRNGFQEFQLHYPAKNGVYVESACRAYVDRIHGTDGEHERLMDGLKRWRASAEWQRRFTDAPDGRLIPSMEKFISDGLYLDHPPPAAEIPGDHRLADSGQMVPGTHNRAIHSAGDRPMKALTQQGPERLINTEAERLVVANILASPGFFRRIGPQLTDECFAVEQYRRVYQLAHSYGSVVLPWDGGAKSLGTGRSIEELVRAKGFKVRVLPQLSVADGINAVRTIFPQCWFDGERCVDGLQGLRRYEWGPVNAQGVARREPLHNAASHPADALRTMAMWIKGPKPKAPPQAPRREPAGVWG